MLMDTNGEIIQYIDQLGVFGTTAMRHNRAMNVLYLDLHADSRKEGTFSRYLTNAAWYWTSTSPFWRGDSAAQKNPQALHDRAVAR